MGWAKYSEDNYEAFVERLVMKGGQNETHVYGFVGTKTKIYPKKEKSGFTEAIAGKSRFSF